MQQDGGYDEGYESCGCFWGKEPGSYVRKLTELTGGVSDRRVLDVGCGEGKNAVYMARRGARVTAIEISQAALDNAVLNWPNESNITWLLADATEIEIPTCSYDIVVMYGVLHCLPGPDQIQRLVSRLQAGTTNGGYHVLCTFNDREHDLSAHPDFDPTLLSHDDYLSLYSDWRIEVESDEDLHEVHPHNLIPHVHSMSRIIARKIATRPPS